MEENIVSLISEAESKAAEIKARAQAQAAEILAAAEKSASETVKRSETACAAVREQILNAAEGEALDQYRQATDKSRAEAMAYAEGLLKRADICVADIIGRITK